MELEDARYPATSSRHAWHPTLQEPTLRLKWLHVHTKQSITAGKFQPKVHRPSNHPAVLDKDPCLGTQC